MTRRRLGPAGVSARVAAAVCAAVAVVGAGVLAPAPPAAGTPVRATAVTCPTDARPLSAGDVDRAWAVALERLQALAGPVSFPFGATAGGPYRRTNAYAWTSGFYPASLWLAFERTGEGRWLDLARRYTDPLLPVARWRGTHDLGFMIGLPAGLAARLDQARADRYAKALRTAATSLATRWNGRVGALQSGTYAGRWGLIVDSAMNAPLLVEQGRAIGGRRGDRLARRGHRHLLTLARDFVRADGSTIHRQAYDPRTGRLLGPVFGQGASTTSTWARGQAWAIAGFARGYALTGDVRLLDAARAVTGYWRAHVPAGCVPAWDLSIGRAAASRDASAAAIAAYGMLLLADVEPDAGSAVVVRDDALATLGTLTRAPWVQPAGAPGSGVLQRQAYNVPADPREGTYAWGDTYLLAAVTLATGDAYRVGSAAIRLSR